MSTKPLLLTATIIITNDSNPIYDGAILIEGSKILKVGKKESFGSQDNYEVINFEDSLICPGFINLHTHLSYSSIDLMKDSNGLFSWLEKLTDKSFKMSKKDYTHSINSGINELLSTGTTFVVENTPNELSISELSKSPIKSLIGLEVFGSDETKANEIFEANLIKLNKLQSKIQNPQSKIVFSPHAPYDVSLPLWKLLTDWAYKNNKPLLTHLEESKEERNWWKYKNSTAIKFWKKINKLEPKLKFWKQYKSGIDFLNRNNLLTNNIIATHLTNATKEELSTLKNKNINLIHCARSNFYLNNGTANLKDWDELKINWGIGTDSTASSGNLNILEELKFAINRQNIVYGFKISDKDALKKITSDSAQILCLDKEIGSLKEGLCGDFLVFNIQDKPACTYKDPYHLLIWELNSQENLKEVWINGSRAWRASTIMSTI